MLTLAMPQSEPWAERNRSALFIESVKIADDKPWRHAVLHRDRLVEAVDLDQVEDRGEGLLLDDGGVGGDPDDGRLDEVARLFQQVAAHQHLAALLAGQVERLASCRRRRPG